LKDHFGVRSAYVSAMAIEATRIGPGEAGRRKGRSSKSPEIRGKYGIYPSFRIDNAIEQIAASALTDWRDTLKFNLPCLMRMRVVSSETALIPADAPPASGRGQARAGAIRVGG
jgi:hypothetical protein